ncbi:MAG: LysR family transcriptional regulator [Clostridia bacterium]|nr:LysR family transcriptional regulator [Clostridia bacterium]NCC44178.1 LysR family transcriptional regulator [Clostridia bacterium]
MHSVIHVYLYDEDNNRFFGEGPRRLLHTIEETGSLRSAAASMHMAYTKAFTMLKRAEETLGFPLTTKKIGGAGGGGSHLTAEAKEFLDKYESYQNACRTASQQIYHEIFCDEQ